MSDKLSALPLITTVQPNSRFYLTDPAEAVPANRSKAIEWQGMVAALGGDPTISVTLYVNKNGNDITGDGSIINPFLTWQAAVASITDATTSKRYAIVIGPGQYTHAGTLKAFTYLVGVNPSLTILNGGGTLDLPNGADARAGLYNINFSDGTQTIRVTGNQFSNFYLGNCTLPRYIQASGQTNPVLYYLNCQPYGGTLNIGGGNHRFFSCGGSDSAILRINDEPSTATTNVELINCSWILQVIGNNSSNINLSCYASLITSVTFDSVNAGVVTCNFDSSVRVSTITITSGSPVINWMTEAGSIGYTASNPAGWAGSPPTTVQEAIDRIAAFNPGA